MITQWVSGKAGQTPVFVWDLKLRQKDQSRGVSSFPLRRPLPWGEERGLRQSSWYPVSWLVGVLGWRKETGSIKTDVTRTVPGHEIGYREEADTQDYRNSPENTTPLDPTARIRTSRSLGITACRDADLYTLGI